MVKSAEFGKDNLATDYLLIIHHNAKEPKINIFISPFHNLKGHDIIPQISVSKNRLNISTEGQH